MDGKASFSRWGVLPRAVWESFTAQVAEKSTARHELAKPQADCQSLAVSPKADAIRANWHF
jgi:hypothetical protein